MASPAAPRRRLSFPEARARVLAAAAPLPAETLPLAACRGRALREDIRAPHALPPFRNSAMDGFAVRAADLAPARESQPVRLPVAEVIAAGPGTPAPLPSGAAARIMTGACLPEGADAVVPFEETASAEHGLRDAGTVAFVRPVPAGANVRDRGLDLAAGDAALGAGRELSAHDLALLAALGVPRVAVGAPPRAIVLSTGDELLAIEAALEPGRIRDSNSLMLALLLEGAGATVTRCERLRDDPDRVRVRLAAALADADVVLTIGGVSMGDFDPVRDAIAREPWIELWRVAMRPGQPQAFGARDGRLFFGLPGNPASVACVFETLVRPALRVLQGFAITDRPRLAVRAAERVESRGGRTDFVRARLERRNDAWWARPCGAQISGHLTPQSRAHALLVVSEAVEVLEPGDAADALILRWPEEGA